MSEKVSITKSKLDSLANAIASVGETSVPKTIAQMESAVLELTPDITSLTVNPTESQQVFNSDAVDGYLPVTVNGISSTYVGSGITQRDSTDLTASGATVTAPAGYYAEAASKPVASGTAGTPTATKGTVSNHSISVTPSVTNTTGYIIGDTKTGTAVTVSASELVSGTKTISASGTTDVTNYASASVAAGTAGTPTATKGTVSNHSISVTPSVTNATGYITGSTINGTAVTVDVTELESGTKSITENGTGISVSGYSAVDVDVPGQVPTGVKYIYTDIDGEGAWNVAGYEYCSVDYAPVRDEKFRYWVNISANDLTFTNPVSVPSYSSYRYTGIIDWGDGTQNEFSYGNTGQVHTYSNAGIYCISIWRTGGSERLNVDAPNTSDNPKVVGVELFFIGYPGNIINSLPNAERLSITSEQTTVSFFEYNSVKSVLLPNTVTKISGAFRCYALTKLTIPASVTDCSTGSLFTNNTSMKEYHFLPVNPPSLGSNAFGGIPSDCVIYVPSASLSAYQSATNWSAWASKMVGE